MVAGDFWEQAIAAVQKLKRRAILITGAPPEQHAHAPRAVEVYRYLPYSAVFPRAAVVMYPGGIGTPRRRAYAALSENHRNRVDVGARFIVEHARLCRPRSVCRWATVRSEDATAWACDSLERLLP